MSRRFARFDRPTVQPFRFVDWFIVGLTSVVVALIALAFGAVFLLVASAHARDVGQWEGSNPIIRQWYKTLMQPDNPGISCCGEADAYWADKVEVIDGKVFAIITDARPDALLGRRHVPPGTRVEVPPHKMTWKYGNPTAHIVIFLGPDNMVLCYVSGGGV